MYVLYNLYYFVCSIEFCFWIGLSCNQETVSDLKSNESLEESDSESDYSTGELWLSTEGRQPKRMDKKDQEEKSQSSNVHTPIVSTIKAKVKPALLPKPRRKHLVAMHAGTEKINDKKKSVKRLIKSDSDVNDDNR